MARRPYTQHGLSRHPLYPIWNTMHARCSNPKHISYPRYGGRGIRVCERWSSFESFVEDMGARPKGTSIERGDSDGHYEPGNCRWATGVEQNRNRLDNVHVEYRGERRCLKDWCELLGVSYNRAHKRIKRGYSPAEALGL